MAREHRGRHHVAAVEIDGDDAAWLRGETLPDDTRLEVVDEVEFMGRTYDRAPGSTLWLPTELSATDRVIDRVRAELDEQLDAQQEPPPIGISLFTGCGGFDLGLHQAGFDVQAANENDPTAAHTYLLNLGHPDCKIVFATPADQARWEKELRRHNAAMTARPAKAGKKKGKHGRGKAKKQKRERPKKWIGSAARRAMRMKGGCKLFILGDVEHVTGAMMLEPLGLKRGQVAVVFGGPPCQGLSTANSRACLEDPRNGLLWEFMRLVKEIRPRTFIIENVPRILTVAKGALFNAIAKLANEAGYDVVATNLNAANYGVPQHRVRAIIVGTLDGEPRYQFPMPSTWALGRYVNGNQWHVGGPGQPDEIDKFLDVPAEYDEATRTWRIADAKGGQRATVPPPPAPEAEQLELV